VGQKGVLQQDSFLDQFIAIAPIVQQLMIEDCAISICDLEKVRAYFPGSRLNQKVKTGDPLLPNSGVGRAIATGEKVVMKMGAELFGIPYVVVAVPIIAKGDGIIGGISLSMSVEREERLFQIAEEIRQYIHEVSIGVEHLKAKSTDLTSLETGWQEIVKETVSVTKQSRDFTGLIQKVAKETGILALNSGIEAARQGEDGRVFGIIASRMRELAADVQHSVEEIGNNFSLIEGSSQKLQQEMVRLETISAQIEQTAKQLEDQVSAVKTIVERIIRLH